MKEIKKFLYSLGVTTTVAAPLLVAVSCGSDTPAPQQDLATVTSEELTTAMFPGITDYHGKLNPANAKTENLTIKKDDGMEITGVNLKANAQGEKIQNWKYTNSSVTYSAQLETNSDIDTIRQFEIKNTTDALPSPVEMNPVKSNPDGLPEYPDEVILPIDNAKADREGNIIQVGNGVSDNTYLVATDNNGFYKVVNTNSGITTSPLFESPTNEWEKLFVGENNEISEFAQMEVVAQDETTVQILITTKNKGFFLLSYESETFSVQPIESDSPISISNFVISDQSEQTEIGDGAAIISLPISGGSNKELLIFTPKAEGDEKAFILTLDASTLKFNKSEMNIKDQNVLATKLKRNTDNIAENIFFKQVFFTLDLLKGEILSGESVITTKTEGLLQLNYDRTESTAPWQFSAEYLVGTEGDELTQLLTNTKSETNFNITKNAILGSYPAGEFTVSNLIFKINLSDNPEMINKTFHLKYESIEKKFTTEEVTKADDKKKYWSDVIRNNNDTFNYGSDKFLVTNKLVKSSEEIPYILTFFQHHYSF